MNAYNECSSISRVKKIVLCIITILTSVGTYSLRPCVDPVIRKSLAKIIFIRQNEWRPLVSLFCYPATPRDWSFLLAHVLALILLFVLVFVRCKKIKHAALILGAVYYCTHAAWFFVDRDGFMALHSAISAGMLALYVWSYSPVSLDLARIPQKFQAIVVQEKISATKHLIGTTLAITIAISGSAIAFNYSFMEKTFQSAGPGNYELALLYTQKRIVTLLIWHILIYVFFILPQLYSRIDLILKAAVVDANSQSEV